MNLDDRLRHAADRVNAELEQIPVPSSPGRVRAPWKAVVATAVVTIVAVGSVVVLLGGGADRDEVVTTHQTTTTGVTTTTAPPVEDPPPLGPVVTVAQGAITGSQLTWQLSAYVAEGGVVCFTMSPGGGGECGAVDTMLAFQGNGQTACASGVVSDAVAVVVVGLSDGSHDRPPLFSHPSVPGRWYGQCSWEGPDIVGVTAFDAVGEIAATTGGPTELPRPEPLFDAPTDVVLLFDDGIDGVLAVDLDERRAARSVVPGQAAGDQDPRLYRSGDHLVVGWGDITAVTVVTREAVSLGEATIFVPAAEEGRVWLVDWERGRTGEGEATAWQVVVGTGEPLTDPIALGTAGHPAAGIAGGLALATENGVALWADGEVYRRLGDGGGAGTVVDVHRNRIAWCSGDCDTLHVTDLHGGDHVYSGPFDPWSGRFSPDGRLIAFTDGPWVHVLDAQAETLDQAGRFADPGAGYVGWSRDGEQLFASTYAYAERTMEVLRYRLGDQRLDRATLPFGGALDFVVLDEDEAGLYFDSALEEVCTPSGAAPSRQGICTFEF